MVPSPTTPTHTPYWCVDSQNGFLEPKSTFRSLLEPLVSFSECRWDGIPKTLLFEGRSPRYFDSATESPIKSESATKSQTFDFWIARVVQYSLGSDPTSLKMFRTLQHSPGVTSFDFYNWSTHSVIGSQKCSVCWTKMLLHIFQCLTSLSQNTLFFNEARCFLTSVDVNVSELRHQKSP